MIWLLQLPAPLVGLVVVIITVSLAVLGLVLSRRILPQRRLARSGSVAGHVFDLAGVLYAVLVAFVVVVVWEQLNSAEKGTESEAAAISELLRDSAGLPVASRPALQQSLIAYTNDVVDDEFPRMRRGDTIEQQSDHLTEVWQNFLQVEPVSQREITFYQESITRLDELGNARKTRISGSQSEIPGELWVLLLGGGMVMLLFTYMFPSPDVVVHGALIALAGSLLAFVLYLTFAMEHPFVGSIAVSPEAYQHVLDTWSQLAAK
ncbi:bestrophin-like domain [Mycolicibacterium sp. Dal123E01]|uniref:bestrophin-like domain n=1 Tax=Mycolicibacterium sp. Dal123E01 TaxID=3457578 RepID=UPI00403E6612